MSVPSPEVSSLPRFDPRSPGFRAEPYRVFDQYRIHEPVHWSGDPSGRRGGRWFIFDYRSAATVLTDRRFRRQSPAARECCPASPPAAFGPSTDPGNIREPAARSQPAPSAFAETIANCMLFQDPPKHTRLRSAVKPALSPSAVRALRPIIEQRVRELLEPLKKLQTFDLIRDFAFPIPLDVIGDLLGVDASERATFRRWSSALRDGVDRPKWGSDALVRAEAATLGLREYFEAAWRRHRTQPSKGVLGELFRMEGKDAGLTKDEAFGTFTLLISAGHETTTNLIGTGMYLFAQHPRERERLLEDPDLIQTAIEEILRFESPVQMASRYVAEEIQLRGRRLMPGQYVEVMLGSANRDPEVFEAPARFDAGRKPNPHVAFGLGGHHCIGAPTARLIGAIALQVLLKSVRSMEFPPSTNPWTASIGFRGLIQLPACCADTVAGTLREKDVRPKLTGAQTRS